MEHREDIILIDKPKGITSFDVIRVLRKKLGVRKIGHAGTLDPLATGLLIIGVGEGTKKLKDLVGLSKTYEVEVLLGVRTTTGDLEGEVVQEQKVEHVKKEDVENVLRELVGIVALPVPAYSAVKRGGEALYKKARRGESVEPPVKEMGVYDIKLLGVLPEGEGYVLSLDMDVGSGTYVRSIAEEIGRRLGTPATVKELRRTKVGEFDVADAEHL